MVAPSAPSRTAATSAAALSTGAATANGASRAVRQNAGSPKRNDPMGDASQSMADRLVGVEHGRHAEEVGQAVRRVLQGRVHREGGHRYVFAKDVGEGERVG